MKNRKFMVDGSWLMGVMLAVVLVSGCSTTKPERVVNPEIATFADLAQEAYGRSAFEQSVKLYGRALVKARAADDAQEIGNNAYNMAVCLIALEKYAEAREPLREAQGEFERIGVEISAAELLDAKAARLDGKPDEAERIADQVLAALKPGENRAYRTQALLVRAQVACDRRDAAAARTELALAQKEMRKLKNPFLTAAIHGVNGRIALMEKDPARAAVEFDHEADLCRDAGKYRDMALALARTGQAYADAEDAKAAADRFYRAARSFFAQGDELMSLKMIEAALKSAEKAGDQTVLLRTTALFGEIRKQLEDRSSAAPAAAKPSGKTDAE